MTTTEDRPLPEAYEVERSLLASILTVPSFVDRALELCTSSDFYNDVNAKIFSEIEKVRAEGGDIDIIIIGSRLNHSGLDGDMLMAELMDVESSVNIDSLCKILIDKALRRKTIQECSRIQDAAYISDAIADVHNRINGLNNLVSTALEAAEMEEKAVKILSVKTDLAQLTKDYYFNGATTETFELKTLPNLAQIYKPALGFLTVFTGIPSHGKTELVNQIMVDLSINSGWKWLVYSPESFPHFYMVQNFAEKMVGKGFFYDGSKMTLPELDNAIDVMDKCVFPIDIGDGEFSTDDMLALVREYTSTNNIQGVIIDPIGDLEISTRKSENLTYAIRRFLRLIRLMGRKRNFSPYVIAHTTKMLRDFKTKKYPVPTLYDIDGSAAYYNAAYHGLTTYRYFKLNVVAVHVQKVKFKNAGEVGVRFLKYNRDTGIFTPYYGNPEKEEKEAAEQQQMQF